MPSATRRSGRNTPSSETSDAVEEVDAPKEDPTPKEDEEKAADETELQENGEDKTSSSADGKTAEKEGESTEEKNAEMKEEDPAEKEDEDAAKEEATGMDTDDKESPPVDTEAGADTATTDDNKEASMDTEEAKDADAAAEAKSSDTGKTSTTPAAETKATKDPPSSTDHQLILTSEKRRGIYECDYCHSDISQMPRIRCAVCPDFDLCLDCFATTDHTSAIARLKAAASAHSEVATDDGNALAPGVSSAAINHDNTHGYRVCDCTRYPIFASTRNVVPTEKNNNEEEEAVEDDNMDVDKQKGKEEANEEDRSDKMEVDGSSKSEASSDAEAKETLKKKQEIKATEMMLVSDDPKVIWTAEEDLRLLDAILSHGLGNWADISEAVGGNGSVGKTPKRCMERYFDDYLGRYGHILPPYTVVDDDEVEEEAENGNTNSGDQEDGTAAASGEGSKSDEEDSEPQSPAMRAPSKRRHAVMMRSPSNMSASTASGRSLFRNKKVKVIPTDSVPGYDKIWENAYVPPIPGVQMGQEVGRDLSYKAELTFVKSTSSVASKEEADKIRKEWMQTRMNQIGSPTVLPPRPDDTVTLPGADLAGFMPRRGDFDIEWENEAEQALADMEFTQGDLPQDRQLKLQVLEIYCQKLDGREKRKNFIMSRNLYDYRKMLQREQEMPADERDLVRRMRLFERLHTPEEHRIFIDDILKAKRLRKEIAKLQMYRRIGIRTLAEAEKYELDKSRREFHKQAQQQKDADSGKTGGGSSGPSTPATKSTPTTSANTGGAATGSSSKTQPIGGDSLWKQYRPSDRKMRRSINRASSSTSSEEPQQDENTKGDEKNGDSANEQPAASEKDSKDEAKKAEEESKTPQSSGVAGDEAKEDNEASDKMEVDASTPEVVDPNGSGDILEVQDELDITNCRGFVLLSAKEAKLCTRLRLFPSQYLEIKNALIQESLRRGLLDQPGSSRRTIVKLDVERRGNVIDFMVRAGWISNKLAKAARTIVATPAAE